MAYKNFIPTVYRQKIEIAREPSLVAVQLSDTSFEGDISAYGDTVKFNSVARPTVSDYSEQTGLSDPESLPDISRIIVIDNQKSFNFRVGDIDKRLAAGDVMTAEMTEAAAALAQTEDSFVYTKMYSELGETDTVADLTSATVFSTISGMLRKLYDANVPTGETVTLEVSPRFAEKMLLANVLRNTDNPGIISNGFLDALKVFNVKAYVTTNLKADTTYDWIVMRTAKAFGYAGALSEIEPYRHPKFFADAVRGLDLFGGGVLRPQEIRIAKVSYGAETTV